MQERSIKIRLIITPLPKGIHGMSAKDGNAIMVLINENDDPDTQQQAYIHECLHIWYRDHDRENIDVQKLEAIRNQQTRQEVERQRGRGQ